MQIKEAGGNTVRLSIMPPANAITGQYEIFIETKSKNSSGEILTYRYKHEEQFYILFNAWCAGNTALSSHSPFVMSSIIRSIQSSHIFIS